MQTQVLIVGAGPTGLMAANQLVRHGIDFIIIDSKSGPTIESRAILVTARSLEIYDQMGLAHEALQNGIPIQNLNIFLEGKKKATIHIGNAGKGQSEFSYMLAYEQSKNEELLYRNLKNAGKEVLWNHEFIQLEEYKTGITAVVSNSGNQFKIQAEYLIGCDGARSPIRHQLNFSFKGGTYEQKFFVADTEITWDLPYDHIIISPDKYNFSAFLPLYGERKMRILGTLPKEFSERENISFEDIREMVADNIGNNVKFEKVNWFSTYKLHHRGVDHFSQDSVFLAGDSAHIHSPAGGQGMNTGLQDAYNLTWKMAMVLKNQAGPKLLNTYNEERLPFAEWLLKFTDQGFNMMTSENPVFRFIRKYFGLYVANEILAIPLVRKKAFKTISQVGYSYHKSSLSKSFSKRGYSFKAGDRLPFISTSNGKDNLYKRFHDPLFHLLHISNTELDENMIKEIQSAFPFPIKIIEEKLGERWSQKGVKEDLLVLVRPDNYIALLLDNWDANLVKEYVKEFFNK